MKKYSDINSTNYQKIDVLIENETADLNQAKENLDSAKAELKHSAEIFSVAEKVMGSTFSLYN